MRNLSLFLLFGLVLTACVANQPREVSISSSFDASETRKLLEKGPNVIRGSALFRQRGGGVVSCAGMKVVLIPATSYAKERVFALYQSTEKGYRPATSLILGKVNFNKEPPEYSQLKKEVVCDAQGFFKFDEVANGEFFVTTTIVWGVNSIEGGALMQRVSVYGSETKEIVMAL